ncbi:MAG TPA: PfkB family carbohydrate kinase, partial [Solirubrobacteraceae bacterium]|nr:PfkB family carbohydrate kinase [Solirubrobacteraceae bacterium]
HGDDGADAWTADGVAHQPAVKVAAVDTVGAGDGLCAGFLSGMLDGLDPAAALERGVKTAAFAVAAAGDWEGLPRRDELELLALERGATVR